MTNVALIPDANDPASTPHASLHSAVCLKSTQGFVLRVPSLLVCHTLLSPPRPVSEWRDEQGGGGALRGIPNLGTPLVMGC